jgi:hypothetical protein
MNLNDAVKYVEANVLLQLQQKAAPRMYIVGPPGCGKSDITREICQKNNWAVFVRYISNMSIEQMTGLPIKPESDSCVKWSLPEIFNFSNPECAPKDYQIGKTPTILFLDDFHLCDKMMQKYMFQLLTYKGLNGYNLPENTVIILAGNRVVDRAGAVAIPAPVCNRLMFVEVKSDVDDWLNNFALKNNLRNDILTFLYDKGNSFLSGEPLENTAWPSPRAWTYLSYQMDAFEKCNSSLDAKALYVMASGLVGDEAAADFITYRELIGQWNFDELRKLPSDKRNAKFQKSIKKNPTMAYAIANGAILWGMKKYRLVSYNLDNKDFQQIIQVVYDILTFLVVCQLKDVTLKPLIIAVIRYMKMLHDAEEKNNKVDKNVTPFYELLLQIMQERQNSIDWLFYELFSISWNVTLDSEDLEIIKEAKKELEMAND